VIAPPRSLEIVGTHALDIDEGHVVIASDCHYRSDEPPSTAHRALVQLISRFAEEGSLRAVILNGDVADFPKISKHARIGWEKQPPVAEGACPCPAPHVGDRLDRRARHRAGHDDGQP
jgi:hypothetical protein